MLSHFIHLLRDGMDHVLLVLPAGLIVGPQLLLLPPPFEDDDRDARHHGHQGHGRRHRGDEEDLAQGERGIAPAAAAAAAAATAARRPGLHARGGGGCRQQSGVEGALAARAGEPARADAFELVDPVDASGSVTARRCGALVHLHAAVFTGKSRPARTPII